MNGLTDRQQAALMFVALILPQIATWAGLGFPTTQGALGLLTAGIIGAILVGIKELLGGSAPTVPPDPALVAQKAALQTQIDQLTAQRDAIKI